MVNDLLRQLPQVERALRWPEVEALLTRFPRGEVTTAVRGVIALLRDEIVSGALTSSRAGERLEPGPLAREIEARLERRAASGYRRVINGTGIVLHTGLGRAVLAAAAVSTVARNLSGYSLVEIDPATGERNQREAPLRTLLCELTGAASATVVNNNAAATLLILAALARGKEVIISRGQLVEIGGSFRIPDILAESGARLVEVGTTNRTYVEDYRRALTPDTGLLLQVHTSNYAIRGFAAHAPIAEIVALGKAHGIPVVSDLGSGCFVDVARLGFEAEPLVADSVSAGADLVCFSGDKLLGGPQAGIIVGAEAAVARVRAHPLFRALRVDKVTLALLEATLSLYRRPETLAVELPVLALLSAPAAGIRERVDGFLEHCAAPPGLRLEAVACLSQAGSGSLPAQSIPSWAVGLSHTSRTAADIAAALRAMEPPVLPRVHEGRVLVDFRTVLAGDEADLSTAIARLGE